jgi:excisionase family DNA binding protein
MTVDEVAEIVRASDTWLRTEVRRGNLKCFYIAGKILISREQLTEWLKLNERPPPGPGRTRPVLIPIKGGKEHCEEK